MANLNVPIGDVLRVLEQQFPKELTIAIQQAQINALQQQVTETEEPVESEI